MLPQFDASQPLFDLAIYREWLKTAMQDPKFAAHEQVERWIQDQKRLISGSVFYEELFARRISQFVIITFYIRADSDGWVYPVPSGGTSKRFKAASGKPKYAWRPSKLEEVGFFTYGPHLQHAIQENNGQCIYASSEPDICRCTARVSGMSSVGLGKVTYPGHLPKN